MNAAHGKTSESSSSARWIEGRYAVLVILAVAIGLSAFGLVYVHRQQRRPVDFWGTDAAVLIVRAPRVTALGLAGEDSTLPQETTAADDIFEIEGRWLRVVKRVDVSRAGGFTHFRRSLVTDAAFDWSASPASKPNWQFALEFRDGATQATVLIGLDDATIGRLGTETRASITPAVEALREFLEEHFELGGVSSK